MDGIAGIAGFQWIFIIEGLVTILLATSSLFLTQDFPQSAKMLTEEERVHTIRGLLADHQFSAGEPESFQMNVVWQTFKDPKTYLISWCPSISNIVPLLMKSFVVIICGGL